MNKPNLRFVMTGGPGAGKTTVLTALAERGYRYVPESARLIIKKRLEFGLSPRPPLEEFGREILRMDIVRYRETPIKDGPVFFDRGVVDALALLDQQKATSKVEVERHIGAFRYNNLVLLMPPWQEIYATDAERDQTFAESVQVYETLSEWYRQWEYIAVEVPRVGAQERVDFILETVRTRL